VINAGAVVWAEGAPTLQEIMPAEGVFSLIWLLIALPLLGAAVLLLGGRRTNRWGPYLAVLTVTASACLGILMVVGLMGRGAEERSIGQSLFTWVFAGQFEADMAFQLDQLSMVFVLLITIVGALIHVYSLGYMEHDPTQVLRVPQPLRRGDAAPRPREQLPAPVRRMGGRRTGELPAHRVLAAQAQRRRRSEEGIHHQPRWRRRTQHRDHGHLRHVWIGDLR
jgi:hypothetical protein